MWSHTYTLNPQTPILQYPTQVLLTMYTSKTGAEEGQQKTKIMLWFFGAGFLSAIVFYFFPVFMVWCLCMVCVCCARHRFPFFVL